MPQTAHADHAIALAGLQVPVIDWREGGDPGAQKRREPGQIDPRRNAQREIFLHDDLLGIAAIGHPARDLVLGIIGKGRAVETVLLAVGQAIGAGAAAVDHRADPGDIALAELGDLSADADDPADHLVTGNERELRHPPVGLVGVNVRVADRAIHDLDHDILRASGTARDRMGRETAIRVEGRPSPHFGSFERCAGLLRGRLRGDARRQGGCGQRGPAAQEIAAAFAIAGQGLERVIAGLAHLGPPFSGTDEERRNKGGACLSTCRETRRR